MEVFGRKPIDINTDNASGDAFGRLRISNPETVFESKLLDGGGDRIWSTETNGSGTGQRDQDNSCYNMFVYSDGDFVIRQTIQRFVYQSGKSQQVLLTGIIGCGDGLESSVGLSEGEHGNHVSPFPIYNGIDFYSKDGIVYVRITNNEIQNKIPQSDWNIDKMNGEGDSKINIDFDKCQIFMIDFEWLGVGRVRFGFNIDGVNYYCHEIKNANFVNNVYTKSPNLPVRYEIRSTGGGGLCKQICSCVSSEGGQDLTGFPHIGTTDYLDIPSSGAFNTNPTSHTVFAAIRHQEDKPYSFVRLISQAIITLGDSEMKWSISLLPGDSLVKINSVDTALDDLSFTSLPDSTLEFYSFDETQDTVLDSVIAPYVIEEGYLTKSFKESSSDLAPSNNLISIGEEINGSRWCFLFSVQSYGINDARASLKFTERI